MTVAIDFTASNGNQRDDEHSLHSLRNPKQNQYLRALRSVGNILQYYDDDKKIPAYGFGANIIPTLPAFHKFAMNGDYFEPECDGIKGVEMAYNKCLQTVNLYGPTNFAPIINAVNLRAEAAEVS